MFFCHLQNKAFLTTFNDSSFQRLAGIPQISLEKCSQTKFWMARVWLVDELFYYNYPFALPNFFRRKLNTHELEVSVKVIQVFSSLSIEKDFYIENFFNTYKSTLSNQQRTKIKIYFIKLVQVLQEADLIEPYYRVINEGLFLKTDKLTSTNISEGFRLYEKLSV